MNNFCPSCGSKVESDSQFCINCGYNLGQNNKASENTSQVVDNQNHDYNNQYNGVTQQTNNGYTNGIGIAGFIVSLVSLLCCCGSLSWLSLIFSIVGIKNAKKNNGAGHGLSLAGLIISIISLVIILLYVFMFILAFMSELAL